MATYRKRGKRWRVEIYSKGVRVSTTCDTKAACRDWVIEQEANGVSASAHAHTLAEALKRYAAEVSSKKKGQRWEEIRLLKFRKDLAFVSKPMNMVEPADIAQWRDAALKRVQPGTVLREMTMLRSVFAIALNEWGWVEQNPMKGVARPRAPRHRFRRISPDERVRILKQLGYVEGVPPANKKQVTAYAWLIAIETAMRAGELRRLNEECVFPEKQFARLYDSKNGDQRDVPLSRRALELITRLPGYQLAISDGVLSTTFRKARMAAGIDDMTFHDSRHEGITTLAQKLHILDLARAVGVRDLKTLMVYYNPSAEEIAGKLD